LFEPIIALGFGVAPVVPPPLFWRNFFVFGLEVAMILGLARALEVLVFY